MPLQRRRFLQLAGAAATMRPFRALAAPPLKIRVGSGVGLGAAQTYYAQELGIYKRHDLEVALEIPLSMKTVLTRFAAGTLDIGNGNVLSIAREAEKDGNYVIIAPGEYYNSESPTTVLVQAPSSNFHTGKDLEGKTVMTGDGAELAQFAVQNWIDSTGGDFRKVNFVHNIPMAEVGPPLVDGRIDAALINNPTLTILMGNGSVKLLADTFRAIGKTFLPAAYFAKRDWAMANREAVRRFAAVINETAQWANTHHDETVKLVSKLTKAPESLVNQMVRPHYAGTINLESIQRPLDVAIKYGFIKPVRAEDIVIDTLKD
jgi:NitT/TauT family transport system substrate-binding protein